MIDTVEIRERHAKATAGLWATVDGGEDEANDDPSWHHYESVWVKADRQAEVFKVGEDNGLPVIWMQAVDMDFILHAHEDMEALLADNERLHSYETLYKYESGPFISWAQTYLGALPDHVRWLGMSVQQAVVAHLLETKEKLAAAEAKAERLAAAIREHVSAWDKEDARPIGWDNCPNYPDVDDLRDALGDGQEAGG